MSKKYANAPQDLAQALQKTITDNVALIRVLTAKQESLNQRLNGIDDMAKGNLALTDKQLFQDTDTARKLIRTFIKEIIVKKNTIEIQLHD